MDLKKIGLLVSSLIVSVASSLIGTKMMEGTIEAEIEKRLTKTEEKEDEE